MSNLKGRVALVTGASQGIGRACAMELARMGATVALCARNEAKLREVADEINASRGKADARFDEESSARGAEVSARSAEANALGEGEISIRGAEALSRSADGVHARGAEAGAGRDGRPGVVAEAEGEIEDAAAGFRPNEGIGMTMAGVDVDAEEREIEAAVGATNPDPNHALRTRMNGAPGRVDGSTAADGARGNFGEAHVFALDVGEEESIKACVKAVIAQLGRVEILVNNAGITRDILAMRMKRADWDAVIETNLTGAFLMSQAVMSSMLKARWGRVVNITSVVARAGQAGQANYAASKAGLIGLTRSLARELASRGITVNAVAPGYIETAMTAVLNEDQRTAMTSQIPLGRVGTDRDVAAAVGFLASEEAGYITGHVLDVNGGMYMG